MNKKIKDQIAELTRGAVNIISEDSLEAKLNENRPLNIKFGVDPTAPDIHLGHTVPLQRLRSFQNYGHNIQLIIGDYTAMIGDPSGRSATRPILTKEEIGHNMKTYSEQVFKLLDPSKTNLFYNSEWLGEFSGADLLKVGGKYSVQQLLQRRDFKNRINTGNPLSVTELFYPLLVGFDSVHLNTDIEIGGTDQLFNFLASREMQKAYNQPEEVVITLPMLEGLDGIKKMSKGLDNAVGVTETPNEMYGKIMSISDDIMWKYYELLSDKPLSQVSEMKKSEINPMEHKMNLAHEIVSKYHGHKRAEDARKYFYDVHRKRGVPENIETISMKNEENSPIVSLLIKSGKASTKSEARRLIKEGAVKLDNERINDFHYQVKGRSGQILRVGKKFYREIDFENTDGH